MRFALLLLTGFCLTAPLSAQGTSLRPTGAEAAASPDIVKVDRRCGRHRHYVPGHRSRRDGHYMRGYCARDRGY
jgi:hypothetical protein